MYPQDTPIVPINPKPSPGPGKSSKTVCKSVVLMPAIGQGIFLRVQGLGVRIRSSGLGVSVPQVFTQPTAGSMCRR